MRNNYPEFCKLLDNSLIEKLNAHKMEFHDTGQFFAHRKTCKILQLCHNLAENECTGEFAQYERAINKIKNSNPNLGWIKHWKRRPFTEAYSFKHELLISLILSQNHIPFDLESEKTSEEKSPDFTTNIKEEKIFFEATFFINKGIFDRISSGMIDGTSDALSSPEIRGLNHLPDQEKVDRIGPEPEHSKISGILEEKSKKFNGDERGVIIVSGNFLSSFDVTSAIYGSTVGMIPSALEENEGLKSEFFHLPYGRRFYSSNLANRVYGVLYLDHYHDSTLWIDGSDTSDKHKHSTYYPNYINRSDIDHELNNEICRIFDCDIYCPNYI